MNTLDFVIFESPDSNDHEVRIIVDGDDWLRGEFLGIDPPELFSQLVPGTNERLLVGRCTCGCVGCGDISVQVCQNEEFVEWHHSSRQALRFRADDYHSRIKLLVEDTSWEPLGREVERHLNQLFAGKSTIDGYMFRWSSTRFEDGKVVLCVGSKNEEQLLKFDWDGKAADSALQAGRNTLHELFVAE